MKEISKTRMLLSVEEARQLAERALVSIGYALPEAQIVADHVVDAALCGYEYSGLAKILNIRDHPRFKLPRAPMRIVHQTPVSVQFDGGNEVAMVTIRRCTEIAIEMAEKNSFAVIGVANTWMSGRVAYYSEMVARAGMIGMHATSSTRAVAPPGGTRPVLGTNPISFGFPTTGLPFVFDMGTSAIMGTDVSLRVRLGQELPEGVAIGPDGRSTRDPQLAKSGAYLPFGGHKGFGLGLVMQLFGILAGSALDVEHENGTLIIVLKPDLLGARESFLLEATQLLQRVKSNPRQPNVDEIRIPSERSFTSRELRKHTGIEIDRIVYDALIAL